MTITIVVIIMKIVNTTTTTTTTTTTKFHYEHIMNKEKRSPKTLTELNRPKS